MQAKGGADKQQDVFGGANVYHGGFYPPNRIARQVPASPTTCQAVLTAVGRCEAWKRMAVGWCILSDADALSDCIEFSMRTHGRLYASQSVSVLHGQGHLKGSTEIAPGIYTGGLPLKYKHATVAHHASCLEGRPKGKASWVPPCLRRTYFNALSKPVQFCMR